MTDEVVWCVADTRTVVDHARVEAPTHTLTFDSR